MNMKDYHKNVRWSKIFV